MQYGARPESSSILQSTIKDENIKQDPGILPMIKTQSFKRRGRPRKSAVPIVNCDFEIIDSEDSDIEMPATMTRSRVKFEQEVNQA